MYDRISSTPRPPNLYRFSCSSAIGNFLRAKSFSLVGHRQIDFVASHGKINSYILAGIQLIAMFSRIVQCLFQRQMKGERLVGIQMASLGIAKQLFRKGLQLVRDTRYYHRFVHGSLCFHPFGRAELYRLYPDSIGFPKSCVDRILAEFQEGLFSRWKQIKHLVQPCDVEDFQNFGVDSA